MDKKIIKFEKRIEEIPPPEEEEEEPEEDEDEEEEEAEDAEEEEEKGSHSSSSHHSEKSKSSSSSNSDNEAREIVEYEEGPDATVEEDAEAVEDRLPALNYTEWKGYYMQNGRKGKMPKFSLIFGEEPNEEGLIPVEAEGEDQPGAYTINGTFNPEENSVSLLKNYESWTVDVALTWNEERNGFEGSFTVQGSAGEWFIKPVRESESSSSGSDSD